MLGLIVEFINSWLNYTIVVVLYIQALLIQRTTWREYRYHKL